MSAVQQVLSSLGGALTVIPTTWNPSDKGADVSLSGGNLTAKQNGSATGEKKIRSIASRSTGKYYFEALCLIQNDCRIGFANSSMPINGGGALADSVNAVGYEPWRGYIQQNSAILATVETGGGGDRFSVAIDIGANLIWVKVNAGAWNNNGANSPSAGTGGVTYSNMGTIFVAGQVANNADTGWTVNFGATAFTYSVPAGFYTGFGT